MTKVLVFFTNLFHIRSGLGACVWKEIGDQLHTFGGKWFIFLCHKLCAPDESAL